MSFEIKYDRDGNPVKQAAPTFEEVAPAASIEEVEVQAAPEEPVVSEMESTEQEAADQTHEEVVVVPSKPSPQESWKLVRERAERAERRAAELEAALQAKQQQAEPQEDLDFTLDEEALAEGKHMNKVQKKLKAIENELKQYKQQSTMNDIRSQLKNQFPDWDKVFNNDNLARLNDLEPEIAYALNSASDPYKAGVSAYKMIKRLGIMEPEDMFVAEKAAIQKNAAKPKSMASLRPQQGDSPLSKANAFANGLTEDLKKQMIKEMNDARRGY